MGLFPSASGAPFALQPGLYLTSSLSFWVGQDRRTGAVIPKKDWDARKVEKALKHFDSVKAESK